MSKVDLHALFADTVRFLGVDLWTERRPSGDYRYHMVGHHYAGFEMGYIEATVAAVASMLPGGAEALARDGAFREFVVLSLGAGCNAAEIADGWQEAGTR